MVNRAFRFHHGVADNTIERRIIEFIYKWIIKQEGKRSRNNIERTIQNNRLFTKWSLQIRNPGRKNNSENMEYKSFEVLF